MSKLSKKLFGFLLVFMLLVSSFVTCNVVKAEDDDSNDHGDPLSFEVVETDKNKAANKLNKVDDLDDDQKTTRSGKVRVSILLEQDSTIAHGFVSQEVALDPGAVSYRESLKASQDQIAKTISKEVLDGEKLDVVWNLTLAANIISANVDADKIDLIKDVEGVKDVIIETLYYPEETVVSDDPNMSTATDMTFAQFAWAQGYTGAGGKVAIVDTGLDIEHQSFDSYAFEMAIQDVKSKTGKDVTLLEKKDVKRLWSSLNAASRVGTAGDEAYLNSKVPFRFNYIDDDFDVTHINDTQGEHGSHVASISAGNRFIPSDEGGPIVNALTSVSSQGNAPDAQILVMKVFGKGGGAYDSDYFAAIEDAIVLGADAVNLSLGSSSAGFSYNGTYQDIIDSLVDTNIVWANSAGNNSYWAQQTPFGLLYAEDVNFQTGGSPATFKSSLSVASVDNKGFTGGNFTLNDELIFYNENLQYGNTAISGIAGQQEYIYLDSIGSEAEFEELADLVKGKIAICNRGQISFYVKANAAVANGAIATVIANNQPGTINMNLAGYLYTNPAVSITLADAQIIKANSDVDQTESGLTYYTGTILVNEKVTTIVYEDPYTMSSFSSFGVPGSLSLKPEITAPGGNIYAVNGMNKTPEGAISGGHDQYENMSGTSMASPQMAGIVVLLAQYIRENNLDVKAKQFGLSTRALIQSLLMSTATPLIEDASGSYYSIMNQGSGLVNVDAAMNSGIFVTVENTYVNGTNRFDLGYNSKDGKVKAELGDDPDRSGKYSVEFTLHNITDNDLFFDLDGSFFTQDVYEFDEIDYLDTWTTPIYSNLNWFINGEPYIEEVLYDFNDDQDGIYDDKDAVAILDYVVGNRDSIGDMQYADLDDDGSITTHDAYLALRLANRAGTLVPANGSTKVKVNIDLADYIAEFDNNGAWVEGFLFADEKQSADGEIGVSHSIPVLGFYGGFGESSMIDVGSRVEFDYELTDKEPYMSVASALGDNVYGNRAQAFIGLHGDLNVNYFLGGNPLGAAFDNTIYHADRNAMNSRSAIAFAQYSLIRNRVASLFEIEKDNEVVVSQENNRNEYHAYYYPSDGTWRNTNSSLSLNQKLSQFKEGDQLNANLSFAVEYNQKDGVNNWDATNSSMSFEFMIDDTAPIVDSVFGKRMVSEQSNDILVTIGARDNGYIAGVFVYDEDDTLLFSQGSREDDKTGKYDYEDYVAVFDGTDVSDHIYVELWDYAANVTTVKINLNKDELNNGVDVTLDHDEIKTVVGASVKLNASVSPWGITEQRVTWQSDDESIATVSDTGVVTGVSVGETTITATAVADPSVFAQCKVTIVEIDRELNGVVWDEFGDVYISSFNTNSLPDYDKLSDDLNLAIASLTYDENGTLYGATFDSDEWLSDLYIIDEDTFEAQYVGSSPIGYMDICAAPSLGGDKLLGVYGTYVTIIDRNTGGYTGVFNMATYTGGAYLVGIAYEEQYYHSTYGNTDWVFLLDSNGIVYSTGFLPYGGSYSRFAVTAVDNLGYTTDVDYFQSFYYDGADLYWSRFVDEDGKVDIIFEEDFYGEGSIFNLGSFADDVWPVGGLYNQDLKDLIGADHSAALIDESATFEEHIQPVAITSTHGKHVENPGESVVANPDEFVEATTVQEPVEEIQEETVDEQVETGSLDSIRNYVNIRHDTKADVDHDDDDIATIEITAENAEQHNGLYEIYFDSNYLTLRSVKSNADYISYIDNNSGLITFGYIDLEGFDKDATIATLVFDKPNTTETTVNVVTDEVEDSKPYSSEVFVLDEKILVEEITVEPEEVTLQKGESTSLVVTVMPEDATDKSLTFESSDPSIATVDENGNIVALKEGTVTITITTNDGTQITKEVLVRVIPNSIDILYRTHVQNIGWQSYVLNGNVSGTSGRSLRLEGINIKLDDTKNCDIGIQYTTHVQNYGWMPWSSNGELSGTTGEALRLEAIKIQLTGEDKDLFDVYYRVHAQYFGWLSWTKNGAPAGTSGYAYRLEAIQILVVPKGEQVPDNYGGVIPNSPESYIHKSGSDNPTVPGENNTNVVYRSNVQGNGWMPYKYNGSLSGTIYQGKRLEAIQIELRNKQYSGSIMYNAHVQNIGWQGWKKDGVVAGTVGKNYRLEAIQIKLTGELEENYDIYYRLHVQNIGWMAWAKNGEEAGSAGYSYRVEAMQIVLAEKGGNPPANNLGGYSQKTSKVFLVKN